MSNAEGMTAFVPNGDSRRDTAVLLLDAARDNGLDETRAVVAAQGGFYVSDDLADALGGAQEEDTSEADESTEPTNEPEGEPEVEKAVEQLETENPPVPNADEAVDAAIQPEEETVKPASKPASKAKARKTSGNRAAKNSTTEKE